MTQSKQSCSRREFLTVAAAGSGLSLAGVARTASEPITPPARKAEQKSVFGLKAAPLRNVRIGFVGVGGRGSGLLGNLLGIDGVEIKAICDIVAARVKAAQQRVVAKGRTGERVRPEGGAASHREDRLRRRGRSRIGIARQPAGH